MCFIVVLRHFDSSVDAVALHEAANSNFSTFASHWWFCHFASNIHKVLQHFGCIGDAVSLRQISIVGLQHFGRIYDTIAVWRG